MSFANETRHCIDPWTYLEFREDGVLVPCCARPDGIGSFAEDDPLDLLQSKTLVDLKEQLLTGRLDRYCADCSMRPMGATSQLKRMVGLLLGHIPSLNIPHLPADFDPNRYLALNPDVPPSREAAEWHYLYYGYLEGRRYR